MQGRTLTRSLMVSVALAFAGTAMAQTTDKQGPNAAKQSTARSTAAKAVPASKRLDFVPGHSVKETATRPAAPGHAQPAHTPAKQGSGCGSQEMDA